MLREEGRLAQHAVERQQDEGERGAELVVQIGEEPVASGHRGFELGDALRELVAGVGELARAILHALLEAAVQVVDGALRGLKLTVLLLQAAQGRFQLAGGGDAVEPHLAEEAPERLGEAAPRRQVHLIARRLPLARHDDRRERIAENGGEGFEDPLRDVEEFLADRIARGHVEGHLDVIPAFLERGVHVREEECLSALVHVPVQGDRLGEEAHDQLERPPHRRREDVVAYLRKGLEPSEPIG